MDLQQKALRAVSVPLSLPRICASRRAVDTCPEQNRNAPAVYVYRRVLSDVRFCSLVE